MNANTSPRMAGEAHESHAAVARQLAANDTIVTNLLDALFAVPGALRHGWGLDWSPLVDGLADARNLFVIGRGCGFGATLEAALKFKETCALHAEAFSAAEVRHDAMALVDKDFPVLFFSQNDDTRACSWPHQAPMPTRCRWRNPRIRSARRC